MSLGLVQGTPELKEGGSWARTWAQRGRPGSPKASAAVWGSRQLLIEERTFHQNWKPSKGRYLISASLREGLDLPKLLLLLAQDLVDARLEVLLPESRGPRGHLSRRIPQDMVSRIPLMSWALEPECRILMLVWSSWEDGSRLHRPPGVAAVLSWTLESDSPYKSAIKAILSYELWPRLLTSSLVALLLGSHAIYPT